MLRSFLHCRPASQVDVLHEDRAFELLELDAGLDPELVVHQRAGAPVHLEPLCLAAGPVEGEHQLGAEAFSKRVLDGERLELGDECELPAERKLRLDPLLDCGQA